LRRRNIGEARERHCSELMEFIGFADQRLGRLYRCRRRGRKYWSAWGWARWHCEKEMKGLKAWTHGKSEADASSRTSNHRLGWCRCGMQTERRRRRIFRKRRNEFKRKV